MSTLGIQWQIESKAVVEYNRLVQPKALMGINSYGLEFWRALQADNPQSLRIFRFHPNFDEKLGISLDEPEHLAAEAVKFLKGKIGHLATTGAITHILGMNEWVHSFEHEKHPLADRFMASFIPAVRAEVGLPVVVLNAACGHFAEETVDLFPLTLQKLAEEVNSPPQRKSFLGFHEYDYPTMDRIHQEDLAKGGDGYWLCGKWKRIMPKVRERYGPIQCIVTEAGDDGGVVGLHRKGFRSTAPDLDSAARQYCGDRSLRWYKRLLDEDDSVYAAIIFGLSMHGDWGDFDIKGTDVPKFIAQMPDWEPSQPNGGNVDMDIKIYNFDNGPPDGQTTDWDWLRETFGDVGIKAIEDKEGLTLREGDWIYKLVYLDARVGDANVIVNVRDGDGDPVQGETVMFGWVDAPAHGYADKPSNWTENGVPGPTNENGDIGPGYGTGAYYSPDKGEKGPHWIWVYGYPSDYVDGLGMLGATNHAHVNLGYRAVRYKEDDGNGGGETPEPDDIGKFIAGVKTDVGQDVHRAVIGADGSVEFWFFEEPSID